MNIDIYNPDAYTSGIPHEQFAWLRDNAPVHWHEHPAGYGYWVLSKHVTQIESIYITTSLV